ncbi:MAG: CBS domain-containing protein [Bryobacteraceae bacterium]|nr:CBS domain-containing protein [Bryobacteraceae bacterium]
MTAEEIMSSPPIVVQVSDNVERAAGLMLEHRIGCVPVMTADGTVAGIITQSDFARKPECVPFSTFRHPYVLGHWLPPEHAEAIFQQARLMKVQDIMTARPVTVAAGATLEQTLALLLKHEINHLPVMRGDKLVGVVSRFDLLKLMLEKGCP